MICVDLLIISLGGWINVAVNQAKRPTKSKSRKMRKN